MPSKCRIAVVLPSAFIFSLLFVSMAYAGVGLSPASIDIMNMTRGGYSERYITVSNPSQETTMVTVSAEGKVSEFLSFDPGVFNLTGGSYQIVKINATTPIDIPNGIYEGTVFVVGRPILEGEAEGSRLLVASAVSAKTMIEVIDIEYKEYSVEAASVYETEECRDIQVTTTIRNTGNVRVTPKINIKVTSEDGTQTLEDYDFIGDVMLPTTLKTYSIRVPYKIEQFKCLPVGSYKLIINYYVDESQTQSRYLGLKIFERGALSVSGNLLELYAQPNVTMGETLKIDGLFKNTGQLPIKSKLKIEAYQGDRFIEAVEGEEIEVGIDEVKNLTAYYKPSAAGNNILRGRVVFESKLSNIKEIGVEVFYPITMFIAIAVIAIVVIIAAIFILRRKSGGRKGKSVGRKRRR